MLRVVENVLQFTLSPELLAKKDGQASVHVAAVESVLSDDGKVYPDQKGPGDVHELDAEIVADARALAAKIARKRADRLNVTVRFGSTLTEPAAG